MRKIAFILLIVVECWDARTAMAQVFEQSLLFPPEDWHNHSSSIVELSNGDLLVAWYHGLGESQADDALIMGTRKRHGQTEWSEAFVLADTPEFPDLNPVLFIDPRGVLWLFWVTFIDNSSKGVLIKYRTSTDYQADGPPAWNWQEVLLVRPESFEGKYASLLDSIKIVRAADIAQKSKLREVMANQSTAIHDKLHRRLGWMIRTAPIMTSENRLLLGLYHDVFACGLAAFTEDWGRSWSFSEPILDVYLGLVQPSFAMRKDGSIIAYLRDNGFPRQIRATESTDGGKTWSPVRLMDIPNPGSSVQVLVLSNHLWLLVCNDLEKGRHRLTAYLSEDEGKSWKWRRTLEDLGEKNGEVHYPCMIQSRDGSIHGTYSYGTPVPGRKRNESIRYVHFSVDWVKAGNSLSSSGVLSQ